MPYNIAREEIGRSAYHDISIRIEIYGTCQSQKIGSALASLGVFAFLMVANPRKGRLRDAEAAEGKGWVEAADAERQNEI